jgi:20S proteasome alpha/beta subunit
LVVGYDRDAESNWSVPKLYQLASQLDFAPMLSDYGFAVAGVAQYALYLLNRLYEPGRSVEEMTALAIYVITETASQDGKVGGPVSVVTVKPEAGCEALAETAVHEIVTSNEARSTALRDSFYRRGG